MLRQMLKPSPKASLEREVFILNGSAIEEVLNVVPRLLLLMLSLGPVSSPVLVLVIPGPRVSPRCTTASPRPLHAILYELMTPCEWKQVLLD